MPRQPLQQRSRIKQEKILKTAKQLFAQKNYFIVSTNEIAKVAGVSIGTLYSYFKDKKAILLTLLNEYNQTFDSVFGHLNTDAALALFENDTHQWLQNLVNMLSKLEDQQFHSQIEMLSYTIPEVQQTVVQQKQKVQELTRQCILEYSKQNVHLDDEDIDNLSIILFDFISSLVDEIIYGDNSIEQKQQLQNTGITCLELIIKQTLINTKEKN
ncbi:TetR/AcrR family transcriptional regulator [Bombilactobacillus bombi]|uniref:TetR/AcrR family transcriptional regulator n=1 Tax=Bombilactobacillus bombi TaxID=1303590 RepID=A0A347SR55_9LACO|nr:TetR/AcrR family transcriptional regulator [Bombilactobacillus bombi]AXX64514.1 TetR/AcrR family transcriptional regulator [Bombilactobacillus bombi]RHW49834.1 TetR/AcrR family transcriptional regulator [Bombilactobacillus bombi]